MKNKIHLIIILNLTIATLIFTGCNKDWLNYSPIDMYSAKIETASSDKTLNVAAVSLQPSKSDKQETLGKMQLLIEQIKVEHPDIEVIVFPELALEWYYEQTQIAEYQQQMSETIPGNSTDFITDVAIANNVTVVFGLTELDNETGKLYNSQVLIRPNGELTKYRKRNLNDVDIENLMNSGENGLVTVEIDGVKCAMFVCSDMQSESITKEIAESDIDVILHSLTSTTDLNPDISYVGLQMNKWIVFANRFGDEDYFNYTGFIQIINPAGTVVQRGEGKDVYVYSELQIN